jgi:tetratricopeptide (TPR) repeat protein
MNCGQQLPDVAKFCMKCGSPTTKDFSAETPRDIPQTTEVSTRAASTRTYAGEVIPNPSYDLDVNIEGQVIPFSYLDSSKDYAYDIPTLSQEEREEKVSALLKEIWLLQGKDRRKALRLCIEALRFDKHNSEIYYKLGEVLEESHRYEDALNAYEYAIRIGTMLTSAFNLKASALENKARILNRQKRYKEALSAIEESIRLDPGSSSVYSIQWEALLFLGRHHEADSARRSMGIHLRRDS